MISATVRRSAASLVVAAVLLWALARARLIDVRSIIDAAVHAPGTLLIVGFLLLVPLVVGSIRYYAVLRAMARYVPLTSILAASFISAAVSIWMPASAGFMEVIRFGLLVRSTRRRTAIVSKTDLAVVGLVDRLVGLATVALVGLLGGAYVLVTPGAVPGGGTRIILTLTMLLAIGCALPFAAVHVPQIERMVGKFSAVGHLSAPSRMVAALRQLELRSPAFALAFVASLGVSAGAILTTYLAMKLFAPTTPLLAVAIGFPMLVVASLLPGSVAGFGGNQVAAAAVFGALSLDPKAAVLSSFLVSTVNLVTTSVAGVMWLPHAWQNTPEEALMTTGKGTE
jgi:uncharacterized membrane protein YbhN (UPF0104 family)